MALDKRTAHDLPKTNGEDDGAASEPSPAAFLRVFLQLVRFGTVGVLATAVHFAVAFGLATGSQIAVPLIHMIAFVIAFIVSFVGHYFFTFQSTEPWRRALVRFLGVALFSLGFSTAIAAGLSWVGTMDLVALTIAALSVPLLTYYLSKRFAF